MKMAGRKREGGAPLWRRNAVVASVAVFVCAAVYLNWSYGREETVGKDLGDPTLVSQSDPLVGQQTGGAGTEGGQAQVTSGYFATARLNRQQARDSALTLLQDAAARQDADQTMRDEANAAIQTMADYTVTEAQIENLVVAKGYADCVAFIGEDSVSLAVAAPEAGLTDADTARIVDVVNQTAGFTAEQIKIIEVE